MGWISYRANYYNGKGVDKKRECDELFTSDTEDCKSKVIKSSMVGNTYYGAVETVGKDGNKNIVGVVCLTSVDNQDYFNFSYKDMDETCGPYAYDCPKSILDVLSDTDNECALEWRRKCREKINFKKLFAKAKVGDKIKFIVENATTNTKAGDEIVLVKESGWKKPYWCSNYYKWTLNTIIYAAGKNPIEFV